MVADRVYIIGGEARATGGDAHMARDRLNISVDRSHIAGWREQMGRGQFLAIEVPCLNSTTRASKRELGIRARIFTERKRSANSR
jgi:hypothetical protein